MERFTISKSEKQTIYEIYRACRLCGAGGGYRMPIIQNIIDLDSSEVELRQKIQECLQLEIRPDDRMPPLICELCVDKVNDYYKFLELTRLTNVRTRTRLGLPLQTAKKGEPESNDCILGVTEPVFAKDEPPAKKSKAGPKSSKNIKIKKESDVWEVKVENPSSSSSRSSSMSSRSSRGAPPPPAPPPPAPAPAPAPSAPAPRPRRRQPEPETLKQPEPAPTPTAVRDKKARTKELQTLLEDNMKFDDTSLLVPRAMKRTKDEPPRPVLLPKRAKPAPPKEPVKEPTPPPVSKPGPKSKKKPQPKAPEPPKPPEKTKAPEKTKPPEKAKPPEKTKQPEITKPTEKKIAAPIKMYKSKKPQETPVKVKEPPRPPAAPSPPPPAPAAALTCVVCDARLKNMSGFVNHMRTHPPTFTKPANACDPCGKWFTTAEEANVHHSYHRASTFPYHCRHCFGDYTTLQLYNQHIKKGLCKQAEVIPDISCDECGDKFATETLRNAHKCSKPTVAGKCSHCSKSYATLKNLKKHESQCSQRRKRDLIADPDVLRRLKPMQVRILRCDGLLRREIGDHYDVSSVKPTYGLAKNYVYPYLKLPVKPEPLRKDSMVAIPVTPNDTRETDRYSHWDSDDSNSEHVIRRVPSLTTLAIRKLFSKNLLGKVPRKRKRVKNETFDNDDFGNISSDINDIISSLGDDLGNGSLARKDLTAKIKDIIGCLDFDTGEADDETVNYNESKDDNDTRLSETVTFNESKDDNDTRLSETENVNESKDDHDTRHSESVTFNERRDDNDTRLSESVTVNESNDDNDTRNSESVTFNESKDDNDTRLSETDNVTESKENNDTRHSSDNENGESTNKDLTQSNETLDSSEANNAELSNDVELSDSVVQDENTNNSNEENVTVDRIDTESENNLDLTENGEKIVKSDTEVDHHSISNDYKEIDNFDTESESHSNIEDINKETDNLTETENHSDLNNDNPEKDETVTDESNFNINDDNIEMDKQIETENHSDVCNDSTQIGSLRKSLDEDIEMAAENENQESENAPVNGTDHGNDSFEDKSKMNDININHGNENCEDQSKINDFNIDHKNEFYLEDQYKLNDCNIDKKSEEISNKPSKESPIKHSIENLIGETEKNPDKYIKEVISSIEDIIQKNQNDNHALNGQNNESNDSIVGNIDVKEKRLSDNDKMTLDDLLPNEDRPSDLLDNISDDDFNFDV